MKPDVILYDEPTSALDPEMIHEVLGVMRRLTSSGMTSVIVTHEIGFARDSADRIVFMDEGRIIEEGTPGRFFSAPRTDRARNFLEKILQHSRATADDDDTQNSAHRCPERSRLACPQRLSRDQP